MVEQMSAQPGTQIPPMAMARATGRFSDERLNSARGQRRLMRTVARMQGSSANITAGPEQPSGTAAPAASAGTPFGPGGGGFPGMMGGMGMGASMMGEGMPPMMGQMGGQGGGPPWQSTGATAGGAAGPALPSAGQPRAAKPEEAPPVPPGAVRVVLVTDKGELASGSLAMGEGVQEARGWVRIDVPLGELKGDASALKGKVERIIITGDRPGDFYLGQVAIVVEDSPLDFEVSLNVGPDGVAKVGEALSGEVKMIGPVGPNEVRCSWDFDDRDGVGGDLSHRKVRFQYSEPGEYVVTVTVADIVGRHGVARKQVKLVAEGEEGSPE